MHVVQPEVGSAWLARLRRIVRKVYYAMHPARCSCGGNLIRISDAYYEAQDQCSDCGRITYVAETFW